MALRFVVRSVLQQRACTPSHPLVVVNTLRFSGQSRGFHILARQLVGVQRPFGATLSRRTFASGINTELSPENLLRRIFAKVPKGFEDFFPKDKKSDEGKRSKNEEPKKNDSEKEKDENEPWWKVAMGRNDGDKGGGGGGGDQQPQWTQWIVTIVAIIGLMWLNMPGKGNEIHFQHFLNSILVSGDVERLIVVNGKEVRVVLAQDSASSTPQQSRLYFSIGNVESFERKLEEAQRAMGIEPQDFIPISYTNETPWLAEVAKFAPTLLIIGVWLFIMRRMGGGMGGMGGGGSGGRNVFQIGKANPTIIKGDKDVKTTFADVAGLDEAKVEIMEFVEFLRDPQRFLDLGAKIPKGALLVGPPGTGKTLMARAVAGEANVPFYSISGSDFIEMFVGVGPSRVRDLFEQARKNSPCIVFIDEIDAVGRKRSRGGFQGGNDERENTLNQLLVEMDGFTPTENIVVLAGTNRADILDQALLRPGRFDRQISIDNPDMKGRHAIFLVHLANLTLDDNPDDVARRMATLTPGFSGADIANVVNEAALIAARRKKTKVDITDFDAASERVIGGLEKKNKVMSKEERTLVAYHEAGHAIAGWFLEHADPLLKISIVPRGVAALGYNQFLPRELSLYTREQLMDMMCMALGGRVSEELSFDGRISTGAVDDLDRVTKIAYSQVAVYGFNERVGRLSYQNNDNNQFYRPFSEQTANMIDEEARKLVNAAYDRTKALLLEHSAQLEQLAEVLLERETITHDDVVKLIGPRPFNVSENYREFLQNNQEWADRADDRARQKREEKTAASE